MSHVNTSSQLPDELVTETLLYLDDDDDLWRVARASKKFHALAIDAGLVLRRSVSFGSNFQKAFDALHDIAHHSKLQRQKGYDVPLVLSLGPFTPREEYDDRMEEQILEKSQLFHELAPQLFDILPDALPSLVYAYFDFPNRSRPQLYAALCRASAPRLRRLTMSFQSPVSETIPHDLFQSTAPLLRTIRLYNSTLPSNPVRAFNSASHATISFHSRFPSIHIPSHFPNLNTLRLEYTVPQGVVGEIPQSLDLSVSSLRAILILETVRVTVDIARQREAQGVKREVERARIKR